MTIFVNRFFFPSQSSQVSYSWIIFFAFASFCMTNLYLVSHSGIARCYRFGDRTIIMLNIPLKWTLLWGWVNSFRCLWYLSTELNCSIYVIQSKSIVGEVGVDRIADSVLPGDRCVNSSWASGCCGPRVHDNAPTTARWDSAISKSGRVMSLRTLVIVMMKWNYLARKYRFGSLMLPWDLTPLKTQDFYGSFWKQLLCDGNSVLCSLETSYTKRSEQK
jgi:hypothetical protein